MSSDQSISAFRGWVWSSSITILWILNYRAYLCCTKCRYSTCCTKAISLHVALFHSEKTKTPIYDIGAPVYLGKDMFCCCGFKTYSGNKMAKHLATNGCSTAYPDAVTASQGRRGSGGGEPAYLVPPSKPAGDCDEITSYDPNEEMAKAYLKDKGGAERLEPEGPLTFLGLQQKKEQEGELDNATKNAKIDHCEGSKKDEISKDTEDSIIREVPESRVGASEKNHVGEAGALTGEDQRVSDSAPSEPAVNESEDASRSMSKDGDTATDTPDTATKEPCEQVEGPAAPTSSSDPTELFPQGDSIDGVHAHSVSSQELLPAAETGAQDVPQSGGNASLADEEMDTEY